MPHTLWYGRGFRITTQIIGHTRAEDMFRIVVELNILGIPVAIRLLCTYKQYYFIISYWAHGFYFHSLLSARLDLKYYL